MRQLQTSIQRIKRHKGQRKKVYVLQDCEILWSLMYELPIATYAGRKCIALRFQIRSKAPWPCFPIFETHLWSRMFISRCRLYRKDSFQIRKGWHWRWDSVLDMGRLVLRQMSFDRSPWWSCCNSFKHDPYLADCGWVRHSGCYVRSNLMWWEYEIQRAKGWCSTLGSRAFHGQTFECDRLASQWWKFSKD